MVLVKGRTAVILIVLGLCLLILGFLMDPEESWRKAAWGLSDTIEYAVSMGAIAVGSALVVFGHMMLAPKLAESRSETVRETPPSMNGWCALGLVVALGPILLTWAAAGEGTCVFERNNSIGEILLNGAAESRAAPLFLSGAIFLAGTLVVFVTPLGAAVQASGVAVLLVFGTLEMIPFGSLCGDEVNVMAGGTLGALSAALVVAGFVRPIGITSGLKLVSDHPRLWTFKGKRNPRKPST